ncbi:MAG: ArsA-related P-loop ATPase, partial [Actinomycetes bacterium]
TQARVVIVAGKGGVGKTTVTAALARLAAGAGLHTLIVEVDGKSGLAALFGRDETLTYEPTMLAEEAPGRGAIEARTLTPDDALTEYLVDHGLRRLSNRLSSTGTLDVVATAVPGIKDILVLGKVKQLEQASAAGRPGSPDLILVDAPAAGHAVTFLASAHGLLDAVNVGPIQTQAAEVVEMLGDPARCQVLLVTMPEETPVNEVVETAYHLEDRAGVQLAPVVVNGVWSAITTTVEAEEAGKMAGVEIPPALVSSLDRAAGFRTRRRELQREQVTRLREALPLPQLALPYLFTTDLGPAEVERLRADLAAAVDQLPAAP